MSISDHIKYLGVATLIYHLSMPVIVLAVAVPIVGVSFFADDGEAPWIVATVVTVVAGIVLLMALPGIAAGIGLIMRKRWSRIVALIVNALGVFNFPFGTALTAYTFWVLMKDEASAQLEA